MFFRITVSIIHFLLWIFNGTIDVQGKEHLPEDDTYVLIAPHRSLLDPVFIVIAAAPREFTVMAKAELFENALFGWFIRKLNAFPVDRENPGPSAIKTPVKALKNTDKSFLIFPSGTRHSTDLKGGAVTIAKMSKKPIVPAYYDGPLTFKELFLRKKARVCFGQPFIVERKLDGVKDITAHYNDHIQAAFDQLAQDIQPKK